MNVIREHADGDCRERQGFGNLPIGLSEGIDMINQQSPIPARERDREEVGAALNARPSIARHD